MISKPMICILDGTDKVGKTTMKGHLHKAFGYRITFVDRFTPSQYVYAVVRRKKDPEYELQYNLNIDRKMLKEFNVCLVYLYADDRDIEIRAKKHKDDEMVSAELSDLRKEYDKYLSVTPYPRLMLNTSALSIEACVDAVGVFLETVRRGGDHVYR